MYTKLYTILNTEEANKMSKQRSKRKLRFSGSSPPAVCIVCHHYHCHTSSPNESGFYTGFFCQGEIRFYVFINMYSLFCFPLNVKSDIYKKHEQKSRDAAAKSTDTRGVGISSMRKSIYLLKNHTQ